jgi:outer membrane protein OmpA-like peptidoglycan-associated protein
MKQVFTILLFMFAMFSLNAQNLIHNPSFEQFDGPIDCVHGMTLENHAWDWFEGALGSGVGVWHTRCREVSSSYRSWRQNFKPNTGEVALYVGFEGEDFRITNLSNLYVHSYFYSKLKKELTRGSWYRIKVNIASYSSCIPNNLTACLSYQKPTSPEVLERGQQFVFLYDTIVQKNVWKELSLSFKPKRRASYLAIGAINVNQFIGDSLACASYLIDDISFEEIKPQYITSQILFQSNSAKIRTTEIEKLNKLYEQVKEALEITIYAHTDNQGNEDTNQQLSEERAKTVVEFLVKKGIAKEKITSKGYGSQKPIASNDTLEGQMLNRRVDIKIIQ